MARIRKPGGCFSFAIIFIVGAIFTASGYFLILKPEAEVGERFIENQCIILDRNIVMTERRVKRTNSPGTKLRKRYRPEFTIRHEVDGQSYEVKTYRIVQSATGSEKTAKKTLDRFEAGKTYPCWYDPDNPRRVVLEKGLSTGAMFFTGLGAFLALVGGLGGFGRIVRGR
jgi:hypothetical protein